MRRSLLSNSYVMKKVILVEESNVDFFSKSSLQDSVRFTDENFDFAFMNVRDSLREKQI